MAERENHPNAVYLTVEDPLRSIRFYTQKLGFTLGNCWPDAKKPLYASLVLDRQVVMVGASLSEEEGKEMGVSKTELRRIKKDHKAFKKHRCGVGVQIYLCVPDADAHQRAAARKKVTALRGPTTHFYGIRDWVASDPDGYHLVFFTTVAASGEIEPAPRKKARRKTRAPSKTPAEVPQPSAESAPQ